MNRLKAFSLVVLGGALTLAALVALSPMPAQAFFGSFNWPTIDPDTAYKIESSGSDVRVYEWESLTVPGKGCVMAFSKAGPVGLDCDIAPASGVTDDWEE